MIQKTETPDFSVRVPKFGPQYHKVTQHYGF